MCRVHPCRWASSVRARDPANVTALVQDRDLATVQATVLVYPYAGARTNMGDGDEWPVIPAQHPLDR